MYSCCGIDCRKCDCYLAAQNRDEFIRQSVAERWSAVYCADIRPAQVNCHGCSGDDGGLSVFCSGCAVRKCCRSKGLSNCASCDLFPCEKYLSLLGDDYAAEMYVNSFRGI